MLKQKKGFVDGLVLVGMLFANPVILIGLGIFLIVLLFMGYFFMSKIIGYVLIVIGTLALISGKIHWGVAFPIIAVGLFLGIDPFDQQLLSIAGVNYN